MLLLAASLLRGASPREVFAKHFENMDRLESLQGRMIVEVKRADAYNYLKFDYRSEGQKLYMKAKPPASFILVSDGKKAVFYASKENTVYVYEPGQYPQEFADPLQKREDTLAKVPDLQRVDRKMLGWKRVDVYEGKPDVPNTFISKFRIWADTANGFLYRLESFDLHGELVSRVDMKEYRRINGVWINLRTENWMKTDTEVIESTTLYRDLRVNLDIPDTVFQFEYPEGARVKDMTRMILDDAKKKRD